VIASSVPERIALTKTAAFAYIKKDHPVKDGLYRKRKYSGCWRCCRGCANLGFGFRGSLSTLQVSLSPFPFLSFVVLLAHIYLYFADRFRFFSAL
jgi:hypothetical protein